MPVVANALLTVSPFTYQRGIQRFAVPTAMSFVKGDVVCITASPDAKVSEFLHVLAGIDDGKRVTKPASDKRLVRPPVDPEYSDDHAVRIRGAPVRAMSSLDRARAIAFVFENPGFAVLGLTVAEEIRYAQAALGLKPRQYPDPLVLAPYDLLDKLDRPTRVLSGGELHRLAIACAMERAATVLVLDLTRSNLDRDFEDWVLSRLDQWTVAHDAIALVAGIPIGRFREMCQNAQLRTAVLSDGGDFCIDTECALPASTLPALRPRSLGAELVRAVDLGRAGVTTRRQSFTICEGSICCFHGPNGSGKSSIARLIAGQDNKLDFDGSCVVNDRCRPALATQHCERSFLYTKVSGELGDQTLAGVLGLDTAELGYHPRALPYQKQKLLSVASAARLGRGLAVLDEPSCGMGDSGRARLIELLNHFSEQAFLVFTHDPDLQTLLGSRELGTGG